MDTACSFSTPGNGHGCQQINDTRRTRQSGLCDEKAGVPFPAKRLSAAGIIHKCPLRSFAGRTFFKHHRRVLYPPAS